MHRAAVVRSVNHNAGCHNCLPSYTGYDRLPPDQHPRDTDPPSMGSVCEYLNKHDGPGDLPAYVYMPCWLGWGQAFRRAGPYAGFLGKRYDPLTTECQPYGDKDAPPPERQDALDERRRGRFSLRAGDADDRRGRQTEKERHLRKDGNAAGERAEDRGRPRADARDDKNEIGVGERLVVARRPQDEIDPRVAEPGDPVDELLGRLRVRDGHDRALADKKSREARGGAAFAESDDRHAPAAELLGGDLGVEGDRHAAPTGRPIKPSCVPYRPSASRPRYDHRS